MTVARTPALKNLMIPGILCGCLTDLALSCRPPVKEPSVTRRPPRSQQGPGGRRACPGRTWTKRRAVSCSALLGGEPRYFVGEMTAR